MSERSVPPSEQDLARARRAGNLPLSPLLVAAASLLALRLVAPRSFDTIRSAFESAWRAALAHRPVAEALGGAATGAVRALLLPLLALAVSALVATLIQTGAAWKRESPRRPIRAEGLATGGGLAVLVVALFAALSVRVDGSSALLTAGPELAQHARAATDALLGALFATGLLDLGIRRWQWRNALARTPDEARREARESDGDPAVRQRRRQAHRAMLDDVTLARDGHVLTDGRAAVMVVWRDGMLAPRVLLHASGDLLVAVTVEAENQGIACYHRPDLVDALREVPVGAAVPRAYWEALAALIAEAPPRGSRRSP